MKREEGLNSGKLTTYFMFKENFIMENYMYIKSHEIRKSICRFRISAHDLRIEKGRYESVKNSAGQRIPLERNKRICLMCNQNCIEDEYHFHILNANYILRRDRIFFMIYHYLTKISHYYQKEINFSG